MESLNFFDMHTFAFLRLNLQRRKSTDQFGAKCWFIDKVGEVVFVPPQRTIFQCILEKLEKKQAQSLGCGHQENEGIVDIEPRSSCRNHNHKLIFSLNTPCFPKTPLLSQQPQANLLQSFH